MLEYGTRVVAGVTPGKGGQRAVDGRVPVFDTVARAVAAEGADTACIFVPAAGAPDAILEAVDAGIATIFCITEGIPALDMVPVVAAVTDAGARLIGPNCPGATSPGRAKVGIIPGSVHLRGLRRRRQPLRHADLRGGPGDDRCRPRPEHLCRDRRRSRSSGRPSSTSCRLFAADPETEALVLIGEIGGAAEEEAAAWAAEHLRDVPKAAFIAGRSAPEGRRMGHAGAIVSGGMGTAASKVAALEAAGFRVAGSPTELPALLRQAGYGG